MRKTSFDNSASLEPFNECVCHGMLNLEKGACLNLTADLSKGYSITALNSWIIVSAFRRICFPFVYKYQMYWWEMG